MNTPITALQPQAGFTLDYLVSSWLEAKKKRTGSKKTEEAYSKVMGDFRAVLRGQGYDLFSPVGYIMEVAKIWAGLRTENAKRTDEVSANTYNQRLFILSSFYTYAQRVFKWEGENPIKRIQKRPAHPYDAARGLDVDSIADTLAHMNRATIQGKREYALLLVALSTGRRASELLGLRVKHLSSRKAHILVVFEHVKGGGEMRDKLEGEVSQAVREYLCALYGEEWSEQGERPVWVSFDHNHKGQPLTMRGFNHILLRLVGTTKIHALRHTFAEQMDRVGASTNEIRKKLGHASIKTTQMYLDKLTSDENPHAKQLVARFLPDRG